VSISLQSKYVTIASRMYYVDVNRLRTLWNCCGWVSVHETSVIWSLHCCIAIFIHLTGSWQTTQWDGLCQKQRITWIKTDQLDVTCFIISLFTAQHVSNVSTSIFRSLRLVVDLFHVLYCSCSMCVGVTVWFGWGGVVSLCRLKH
jgi:hypothetical protein